MLNIDPQMAMNAAAQQDIDARRRGMESLSHAPSEVEKQEKMRGACEGFEAVFIQKMWEQMRASLPKEGLMKSKEEEYWQSMYDQELGKSMASAGGIGLADMMMQQLGRNNQEISDATRDSAMRRPHLNVSPAPLLPPSANIEHKADAATAQGQESTAKNTAHPFSPGMAQNDTPAKNMDAMNIYDGEALLEAPLAEMPYAPEHPAAGKPAGGQAVALAADTPPSVRQTLDELARLEGVNLSAAAPEPQIIRHTYQTNLPPSQRKADLLSQNTQQRIETTAQSHPLNTSPTGNTYEMPAGLVPGYIPVSPANTPQSAMQASAGEAAPDLASVAKSGINEAPDILAGIQPRFIPSRYQPQRGHETMLASMDAINVARPGVEYAARGSSFLHTSANPSPLNGGIQHTPYTYTGGPALTAPEDITAPVAMGNPAPPRGSMDAPVSGELSSGFGWRIDPFTGQRSWHAGVDIKAQPGESVRAASDGVVAFAGPHPELGNLVVVDHGEGLRTFYGHNQNLEVQVGQQVNSGMKLASAGASGRAAGAHVHFEVRRGELALNPEPLLRQGQTQTTQVAQAR